jgi:hypothetical protein
VRAKYYVTAAVGDDEYFTAALELEEMDCQDVLARYSRHY